MSSIPHPADSCALQARKPTEQADGVSKADWEEKSPAVAASGNGRARSHDRETDVAVVFRWAGVVRGCLLHASSGSAEGELRATVGV